MTRYTIDDLKTMSDYDLLYYIVQERRGKCTNHYSPLSRRLKNLMNKLDKHEELTKTESEREEENIRLHKTKLEYE